MNMQHANRAKVYYNVNVVLTFVDTEHRKMLLSNVNNGQKISQYFLLLLLLLLCTFNLAGVIFRN